MIRLSRPLLAVLELALLAGLAKPPSCLGQVTGATLAGMVTDPTGAGIPEASITAINTSTGVPSKTVTDTSGSYVFPSIQPGTYNITAEKTGFKTKTLTGVTLLVGQQTNVGIPLDIGEVTSSVEVNVQAPMVQSTTASVGSVIEAQQVHDLPLNTRRFGALAVLVPGTTIDRGGFAGATLSSPFAETSFSADGSRSSGNNILIDGVMARALTGAGFSIQPTPDGVQEFKIETVSYNAALGMSSGSIVNLVTKSGTNAYHGTAYEFLRNDKLDARNFFALSKGEFRRNQFGFSVGGPIRKNKTFFFGNYEPLRQIKGNTAGAYIPTAEQKQGNLSAYLTGRTINLCGTGGPANLTFDTGQLFNPATLSQMTCPAGSAKAGSTILVGTPIPGNIIQSINPVAQKALALYSVDPNRPGVPNFVNNLPGHRFDHIFQTRVDQSFGASDQLFGRYIFAEDNQVTPGALPYAGSTIRFRGQNATLGWTHTFSPTMLQDARVGFQRDTNVSTCLNCPRPAGTIAGFGITNLSGITADSESYPQFSFLPASAQGGGGSFATFAGVGDGPYHPLNDNDMVETYSYHLTKILNRHTITAGADLSFWQSLRVQSPYAPHGLIRFNGQYSSLAGELPDTGISPWADFLLGYPASAARTFRFQYQNQVGGWFWNYFVHDDIRVSQNLSINVGLRWEYRRPPVDKHGATMSFLATGPKFAGPGNALLVTALPDDRNDALCTDPIYSYLRTADGRCLVATSAQRKQFGFTGRRQQSIIAAESNLFAPRLGISWRPRGSNRLIVHTGFGMFYDLAALNNQHYGDNNPVFAPSQLYSTTFGAPPPLTSGSPTQTQDVFAGTGGIPRPDSQLVGAFLDPNYKTPKIEQWSFGVQSALTQNLALEVNYIGNHGYNLGELLDLGNQPLPGLGPLQPRRPYPDFNTVLYTTSGATSSYNALQTQLTKRFSYGFTAMGSYTFAKQIDDNEGDEAYTGATGNNGPQDYQNRRANRGLGGTDVRHRFVVSGLWELPFGRGHSLLGASGRLVNGLVGGWSFSSILTSQSGFPLTVISATDFSNTGSVSPKPDRLCNGSGPRTISQWFDASCFSTAALQAAFQAGQPRFGNSGRGIIQGPRFDNLDFGLLKRTTITERFNLQFRAESFNVLNHAQFLDPNSAFGSALFGRVTSAREPRDIQLGLKLIF
jgi:hypothetical protein